MYYNNKKLAISIFWVILGIALIIFSITEVLSSSLYSGFGGGLIVVGILQIIKNIKYRNNKDYKEKIDTASNDERNKFIRMKAWSWTGYVLVLIFAIGMIAAMILNYNQISQICAYIVCGIILLYWIIYLILNKKY